MKIAIVNSLYYPFEVGGAERSVRQLAEALVRAGHRVTVITLSPQTQKTKINNNGVDVIQLPIRNAYWPFDPANRHPPLAKFVWHIRDQYNIDASRAVLSELRSLKCDIVHTNNLAGISFGLLRKAHVLATPIVHTARDYYASCLTSNRFRGGDCASSCFPCGISMRLKRLSRCQIDGFVAISNHVLEHHIQLGILPEKAICRVIHNGVDTPLKEPQQDRKTGARVAGFLGTISPSKGIEILLDASKTFTSPIKVRIGGAGVSEYVKRLKANYGANSIEFCGRVEATQFLDSLDVLVVPSLWNEPFGRVVVEAFRRAIPVIAFDVGAIPELICDGVNGVIVCEKEFLALASAVEGLLADPKRLSRLSQGAQISGLRFSVENCVDKYEHFYSELVETNVHRKD